MDKIEKAMIFAYERHKTQKRKTNSCPYFVHLMDVVSILYKEGASEDLICAGYLHDSVEDFEYTKVTGEEIRKEFGDKIANLVMAVTETDKSLSWLERKTTSIEHLKTASREVKILKCADKLSNIRDIFRDSKNLEKTKYLLILRLEKNSKDILQRSLRAIEEIKDTEMYKEYKKLVAKIFD
jgi:myo-inositol-1(or 4)-monophosphatase